MAIVVASESMQHQSFVAILETLTRTFPAQPQALRDRSEQLLLLSLAVLEDHAPTRLLEARFEEAIAALATLERAPPRGPSKWPGINSVKHAVRSTRARREMGKCAPNA